MLNPVAMSLILNAFTETTSPRTHVERPTLTLRQVSQPAIPPSTSANFKASEEMRVMFTATKRNARQYARTKRRRRASVTAAGE
jgi:hypothetical protein